MNHQNQTISIIAYIEEEVVDMGHLMCWAMAEPLAHQKKKREPRRGHGGEVQIRNGGGQELEVITHRVRMTSTDEGKKNGVF